jgi:hypothetical protein
VPTTVHLLSGNDKLVVDSTVKDASENVGEGKL